MIPIMTPYDAQCFMKYFSSVESVLGLRFSLGYPPDEEHLTSTLCELLDDKGAMLHNLPYSIESLNYDLAQSNGLLRASVKIECAKYNKYQESNLTQSDIGIIINYRDNFDSSQSFRHGILVQAKRLYPQGDGTYSLSSSYGGFDEEQHKRLDDLAKKQHANCKNNHFVFYLVYNPPSSQLSKEDQDKIHYKQLTDHRYFGHHRYDDLYGDYALPPNKPQLQLGISALFLELEKVHEIISKEPTTKPLSHRKIKFPHLSDVIEGVNIVEASMPWFIVKRLFHGRYGSVGCDDAGVLRLIGGEKVNLTPSQSNENTNTGVLPPRYVITISITAGRSHNEEKSV